jgi:heme O synthase-like polyprenyltransferase
VEVLVATIFVGSFGTLLFSVVLSPITSIFPNQLWKSVMGAAGLLLSAAYVAWGMQEFLADPKPPAYWKTFLVSLLYYMVLFTLSTAIIFWYVFQERTPMLLKAFINEVFK